MSDPAINKITTLLLISIYTIFILSKYLSIFVLDILILIYCVIKAVDSINKRNKYIQNIPKSVRLNYINYPDEISLTYAS